MVDASVQLVFFYLPGVGGSVICGSLVTMLCQQKKQHRGFASFAYHLKTNSSFWLGHNIVPTIKQYWCPASIANHLTTSSSVRL